MAPQVLQHRHGHTPGSDVVRGPLVLYRRVALERLHSHTPGSLVGSAAGALKLPYRTTVVAERRHCYTRGSSVAPAALAPQVPYQPAAVLHIHGQNPGVSFPSAGPVSVNSAIFFLDALPSEN